MLGYSIAVVVHKTPISFISLICFSDSTKKRPTRGLFFTVQTVLLIASSLFQLLLPPSETLQDQLYLQMFLY